MMYPLIAEINSSFRMLPDQASSISARYTNLFLFMCLVSGFITLAIATCIVYFCVKYRRRSPDQVGGRLPRGTWVEITWIVIPTIIAMGMYIWGAELFMVMNDPPPNALEIHVIAKQWMWKVQHLSGRREIDALHVPLGRPVKLVMTSHDVIHSFFIPDFRVKQDVLPGRYSTEWFTATKVGQYHLFCAEYCGSGHSHMGGVVTVMTPGDYAKWLADVPTGQLSSAQAGHMLFNTLGCVQCHGQTAPTMAGLYGQNVLLSDGRIVVADKDYLRESIVNPRAKVVNGYQPLMPTFDKQLSEEQIFDLISYIQSLRTEHTPEGNATRPAAAHKQSPPAQKRAGTEVQP